MQLYLFTKLMVIGHSIHNLKANNCATPQIWSAMYWDILSLSNNHPVFNLLSQDWAITNVCSYNPWWCHRLPEAFMLTNYVDCFCVISSWKETKLWDQGFEVAMCINEQAWTWCVCDALNLLGGTKALLLLWFEISFENFWELIGACYYNCWSWSHQISSWSGSLMIVKVLILASQRSDTPGLSLIMLSP